MTTTQSRPPTGDRDHQQQYSYHQGPSQATSAHRRQSDHPNNFVIERPHTGQSPSSDTRRTTNNGLHQNASTDAEHNTALLEHLSADLANLLNRADTSDCFLDVQGTFMAVHKCILAARSNAFAAVISKSFNRLDTATRNQLETVTDKDKLIIRITNTDPEIMKQVVIFMYTAKCDLNEGNAEYLLDAAGRYDIKDLKVHTGQFLASRINANTVLRLLRAAFKYENKLVKQRCIEYFIVNAKEIMAKTDVWKQFAEQEEKIVAELLYWLVNKEAFYSDKPQWDANSRW